MMIMECSPLDSSTELGGGDGGERKLRKYIRKYQFWTNIFVFSVQILGFSALRIGVLEP